MREFGFPQRSNSFNLTYMYKHGKIILRETEETDRMCFRK